MTQVTRLMVQEDDAAALTAYVDYLNLRSGSYMKLEGTGESAFAGNIAAEDPFRAASGYHRIALQVMLALSSEVGDRVIVNTRNGGTLQEMAADDVIETTCRISQRGVEPVEIEPLPEMVRGLVLAVKAYEHAAIRAALSGDERDVRTAMLLYPGIGEWEPSEALLKVLRWRD